MNINFAMWKTAIWTLVKMDKKEDWDKLGMSSLANTLMDCRNDQRIMQVHPDLKPDMETALEFSLAPGGRVVALKVLNTNYSGASAIRASHLLLAGGRRPNTDDLRLEKTGVLLDKRGYIVVDEELRTSVPGIWALGDCNGRGAFTHTSYNDYEIVAANLFDNDKRRISDRIQAYALFIDPPLGRVGAVICWENYLPLLRAAMYAKGIEIYCAPTAELDIHDRVGGGDGFASGFFYGLLTGETIEQSLKLGWAHGALLTTFPGDTTMATVEQVRSFAKGGSARIQR